MDDINEYPIAPRNKREKELGALHALIDRVPNSLPCNTDRKEIATRMAESLIACYASAMTAALTPTIIARQAVRITDSLIAELEK